MACSPEIHMPVPVRGHHFLCILTYRGLGYTPAFVSNMSQVVQRIAAGDPIVLTAGPDAICAGLSSRCRADVSHDCSDPDLTRLDDQAAAATSAILGRDLSVAAPLGGAEITALRAAFRQGTTRAGCIDCSWKTLCDGIAAEGFSETFL